MKKLNGKVISIEREDGGFSEGALHLKADMDQALEKYFAKQGLNKHGYSGERPRFAFGKRCGTSNQDVV